MGLFGTITGATKRAQKRHAELMKLATQQKRQKDLPSAILSLRRAYEVAEKNDIGMTSAALMRLPVYVEDSGDYAQAMQDYLDVAGMKYCSCYRRQYQSAYYGVQAQAWGRLANMLEGLGYTDHSLAYAMGSYFAGRREDWLLRESDRKSGQKVNRWNPTQDLHRVVVSFSPGKPKDFREGVKREMTTIMDRFQQMEPDKVVKHFMSAFNCADLDLRRAVQS